MTRPDTTFIPTELIVRAADELEKATAGEKNVELTDEQKRVINNLIEGEDEKNGTN